MLLQCTPKKKEKEIAPPRDADELYQTIMAKKMAG
jgi:hypothetical protein